MTAFRLAQPPAQRRLGLTPSPAESTSLAERYRPRTLAELVGQGEVVWRLQDFLEAPHSAAFLFEGPTGVGKTTTALCIAAELGAVEFGGLDQIKSGMQDAEAVERVLDSLRFTPMLGSGWKVVVVDEADYMSPKAAQLWLSALEDLPARSVVIFTTNHAAKFPDRFLDRCERLAFASEGPGLLQDAQSLIDEVWWKESGRGDAPEAEGLPGIYDDRGHISYRRVLRAIEPLVRKARKHPEYPDQQAWGGTIQERLLCDPATVPTEIRERDAEAVRNHAALAEGPGYDHGRRPGDKEEEARRPCVDCGTRFGGRTASGKIERSKGRCQSCYNKSRRKPTIAISTPEV